MTPELKSRIMQLPWRAKLKLGWRLIRSPRVPMSAKVILPGTLLYLVWPLDIIPDFIPVLGQLDDVLVVGLGLALFLRLAPAEVVEHLVAELE